MKNSICVFTLLILFSGCSISNNTIDKTQNFILKNNENISIHQNFKPTNKILKIRNASLPLYLNSQSIIYIKDGISNSYAYHFWADTPSDFYRSLLLSKFEKSKIFKALILQGNSLEADYILDSRMDSFEQIINKNENYVKISVSVNLISAKENTIVSHHFFEIKENIETIDIFSTAKTFEKALNLLGNEIILWTNSTLNQK